MKANTGADDVEQLYLVSQAVVAAVEQVRQAAQR